MKLSYNKKSKDPIYYIQTTVRNGKKVSSKTVTRVGKHSELLKITDNPLDYAMKKLDEYNKEYKKGQMAINIQIDCSSPVPDGDKIYSSTTSKNVGYFYLQHIYNKLEIKKFFDEVCKDKKITFNCNDINRFLTYGRILAPTSKLGTYDNINTYFDYPNFDYHHILRFLDILSDNYDEYIDYLYKKSKNIVNRNTSVCYYDCTNYYFEIESPDEEYIDSVTGEIFPAFRMFGISKENRPNPIIQMGLFMDKDSIPISMCINPGSDNEQKSVIPTEEKLIKTIGNDSKFIYCADAGLSSLKIKEFNSKQNKAYIVTQSIKGKKVSNKIREAVFNDMDYKYLSTGENASLEHMKTFDKYDKDNLNKYNDRIYKLITITYDVDTGLYENKKCLNGNTKKIKVKGSHTSTFIVTFSRKYMEYHRNIRNRQIERAKALLKKDIDKIKKGPHDVKRLIKQDKKTNEKTKYILDEDKIKEEEKFDGFYVIATNLDITNLSDVKEIININSNRYKIEDCFRVLKTNFKARPVYHRIPPRIKAHFLTCYTALLIYRILEKKLNEADEHFTIGNIIKTLQNMNVENMNDMYYKACYNSSAVLKALETTFSLGLDRLNYKPSDLHKKVKTI